MLRAPTKTDMSAVEWSVHDEVIRLRQWGTEHSHVLSGETWLVGTAEECSLKLVDQLVSRKHAYVAREHGRWLIHNLGKNGLRQDGARCDSFVLEPGSEIGIGSTTLIAESQRSIALHGFLARILGWTKDQAGAVDHACRVLRMAVSRRTPLLLQGKGDLVPIAQALHRHTLGIGRPFIACDPRRQETNKSVRSAANYASGVDGFVAATGGSLCVRSDRRPRDFSKVLIRLRDPNARVQLVMCMHDDAKHGVPFGAHPIEVPPLEGRAHEVPRIVDEYARDAIAFLEAPQGSFTGADRDWVLTYGARSLEEIEKATLRLTALRIAGNLPDAAKRLGMAPVSLARWIDRRTGKRRTRKR